MDLKKGLNWAINRTNNNIYLDTVNAFINTNVNKEVYITMPKGYKERRKDIVFKL